MNKPKEHDYISLTAYARALEEYCEALNTDLTKWQKMIVMRFDHDIPPTFEQGYKEHDVLEPVTAEHCRWFVAEIERLRNELCTSQAREKKLREALEAYKRGETSITIK